MQKEREREGFRQRDTFAIIIPRQIIIPAIKRAPSKEKKEEKEEEEKKKKKRRKKNKAKPRSTTAANCETPGVADRAFFSQ